MTSILVLVFSTACMVARCNTRGNDPVKEARQQMGLLKNAVGKGFALLELFTSEGCSSCPAADDLLSHVQEEAGANPVYVLAYHVDYWDRLGWKDKFSSPAFSKRQYQYHNSFTSQVYTPQLVVNGHLEVVASDASAVRSGIERALGDSAAAALELNGQLHPDMISLEYRITGDLTGGQLVIAVVQKHAVSKVMRGENAGLTLSHAQIVHNLYKFALTNNKGSVKVGVPEGFNPRDWEVIGMIQDPASGVIKAASRLSLNADVDSMASQDTPVRNIVLVHGAFADGSGWRPVYDILTKKGYHVSIVQNPLTSLKDDVEATNSAINSQKGSVILVGHSWGGTVITEAGVNPKVAGLVYVAAFAPDQGESAGRWVAAAPPSPEAGFTVPDQYGFVYFDPVKFHGGFAADLGQSQSDFMCASQVPIMGKCFEEPVQQVAWKTRPSYGIVATEDKALNPETERTMYKRAGAKIFEIKGSHVVFLSQPAAVAKVIMDAAEHR